MGSTLLPGSPHLPEHPHLTEQSSCVYMNLLNYLINFTLLRKLLCSLWSGEECSGGHPSCWSVGICYSDQCGGPSLLCRKCNLWTINCGEIFQSLVHNDVESAKQTFCHCPHFLSRYICTRRWSSPALSPGAVLLW